jgi:predicted Na+-dependent transporter
MRSRPGALLNNSSFVFILGIVVGLAAGGGASWAEPALVPVLAVVMTISLLDVSPRIFVDFRKMVFPIAAALVLSYVVLGGLYIGLSSLLIDDVDLRTGFVLLAACPQAVSVIPVTFLLGGNLRFTLTGAVATYVAALALAPLICILFIGSSVIEPTRLLIVLGELIVAPMIAAQVLRRTRIMATVDRWRPPVVNWGFFFVIYTVIGLNSELILGEPRTLLLVSALAFLAVFVLGELINRVFRLIGVAKADRISLMLLGTRKNEGMAGAIALVLFSSAAALPAAVHLAVSIVNFAFLTWWVKRMR